MGWYEGPDVKDRCHKWEINLQFVALCKCLGAMPHSGVNQRFATCSVLVARRGLSSPSLDPLVRELHALPRGGGRNGALSRSLVRRVSGRERRRERERERGESAKRKEYVTT